MVPWVYSASVIWTSTRYGWSLSTTLGKETSQLPPASATTLVSPTRAPVASKINMRTFAPWAVIPVAILLGALRNAGPALQAIGVPSEIAIMLEGAILLFAVAGEFLIANRIRRPEREEPAPGTVEAASTA